jgi:hypothetical protein
MATKGLAFRKHKMQLYAGWNDRLLYSYDVSTLAIVFTNFSGNAGWELNRWLFE